MKCVIFKYISANKSVVINKRLAKHNRYPLVRTWIRKRLFHEILGKWIEHSHSGIGNSYKRFAQLGKFLSLLRATCVRTHPRPANYKTRDACRVIQIA